MWRNVSGLSRTVMENSFIELAVYWEKSNYSTTNKSLICINTASGGGMVETKSQVLGNERVAR